MSGDNTWLEQLEARLEQQLEGFLRDNPQQRVLLEQQAARDRQRRLGQERLQLQNQAAAQRRALLTLAEEIRLWQERVARARQAGADDLAERAERHRLVLMEQGRGLWQALGELGTRFAAVEAELAALAADPAARAAAGSAGVSQAGSGSADQAGHGTPAGDGVSPADTLDADWQRFETQQELQQLRRRLNL